MIIQRKPTLASSQVRPHTHLHLLACAISGDEGAILERFLHFCAGNVVTKVTGGLIGVIGDDVCVIGHSLFHIGEHGEFPVINPQRRIAQREVTVLSLSVCVCVCVCMCSHLIWHCRLRGAL